MITQRAVSVRLKKEGIQHMTGTSANCRAEVLEELINETDRPMFCERVLNSTVRYDSDEGHFLPTHSVATSWVQVRAQSSSWLRMRCRLFGGTCGRWRGRRRIYRCCGE